MQSFENQMEVKAYKPPLPLLKDRGMQRGRGHWQAEIMRHLTKLIPPLHRFSNDFHRIFLALEETLRLNKISVALDAGGLGNDPKSTVVWFHNSSVRDQRNLWNRMCEVFCVIFNKKCFYELQGRRVLEREGVNISVDRLNWKQRTYKSHFCLIREKNITNSPADHCMHTHTHTQKNI